MMNLDYKEAGLDRADWICHAINAVETLCGIADDLHTVDQTDMAALLDILNHQLALALRDARSEQSHILRLVPEKDREAAIPLGRRYPSSPVRR
jgi:hypothetical protein